MKNNHLASTFVLASVSEEQIRKFNLKDISTKKQGILKAMAENFKISKENQGCFSEFLVQHISEV